MYTNIISIQKSALCFISLTFAAFLPLPSFAQTGIPTAEQISQLQGLSEQERRALVSAQQREVVPSQVALEPVEVEPRQINNSAQQDGIEANAQSTQGVESFDEAIEEQVTIDPLLQFGYELFAGTPSTFAPATNIPVPLNYIVGPNDTVIFQLYGQRNDRYEVLISREGVLEFPEIGPLNVAGLTFDEMRRLIETTVQTSLIGQEVSVTMGALRSIRVFVLGEAFRPGAYTVSSLSTMTNALLSSGGITNVGSLRNIRLMRQGEVVTELDLYDLLLRGDTSGDVRLQPNDVIFIPPIGRTFGIAGEVKRPAIFELKEEEELQEILPLGGGLLPTAYAPASRIERINSLGERTLVDVDISDLDDLTFPVRDGDILQVYSILDQVEGVVMLQGHVNRPGGFRWREGLRVSDVLPSISDMLPNPDLDFALISREVQPARTIQVLNLNLRDALAARGSESDLELQPRDRLLVFGARQSRQQQVQDLISTLRSQATFDQLPRVVGISGNVLFPGEYPLLEGMTVDDLVKFAGGFEENTELDYAILERQIDLKGFIEVRPISFNGLTLEMPESLELEALDQIIILSSNSIRSNLLANTLEKLRGQSNSNSPTQIVSISGNVKYPGSYPLHEGLNVESLIQIAGGLTESAETRIAEITRFDAETTIGREVGHQSVDLFEKSERGLYLKLNPYDQLIIRQMPNWTEVETVSIEGEVNSPGTYVISQNEDVRSLITRAGGLSRFADPRASIFLRESLRERETRLLEEYRSQLETDIVTLRLQQSVVQNSQSPQSGESEAIQLLDRIRTAVPTGRLVIDLPEILNNSRSGDLILRDGDRLLIPRELQEITVSGEVFRPTSYLFENDLSYADYIERSGGFSDDADRENAYVLKSNGQLTQIGRGAWFFRPQDKPEPGDTIVVPFQAYKPYNLFIWSNIAQIVSSFSTTLLLIDRITSSE